MLGVILIPLMVYLLIATTYQLFLAISYFFTKEPVNRVSEKINKFAIIVPAHNEELLIEKFCECMKTIDYEMELFDIFIIADNCTDNTADIASTFKFNVLTRHDKSKIGKGYALEWAIERINLDDYDSILVLDADTTVKDTILNELNIMLNNGEHAIQCYIDVPNRDESWFTRIIYLSRIINDLLYHSAKYKLYLSSYLMGTGMCFSTSLLKKMKWSAFTLSEDWEYYAKLIEKGYKVAFSSSAIIYQQESSNLKQATSQRLRWASGRFYVVKNLGLKLFTTGLKNRNLQMFDASLALLLPNWSLQINLILLSLIMCVPIVDTRPGFYMLLISIVLIFTQGVIVLLGIYLTKKPLTVFKAVLLAPVFLVWKLMIDILCITKIYKGKEWIRTKRHIPK